MLRLKSNHVSKRGPRYNLVSVIQKYLDRYIISQFLWHIAYSMAIVRSYIELTKDTPYHTLRGTTCGVETTFPRMCWFGTKCSSQQKLRALAILPCVLLWYNSSKFYPYPSRSLHQHHGNGVTDEFGLITQIHKNCLIHHKRWYKLCAYLMHNILFQFYTAGCYKTVLTHLCNIRTYLR